MLICRFLYIFTYTSFYIQLLTKLLSCIAYKFINSTTLTPNKYLVQSGSMFVDNVEESLNQGSIIPDFPSEMPQIPVFNENSTFEELENYSNSIDVISLTIHYIDLVKMLKMKELQKFFITYPKSKRMDKTQAPMMKVFFNPSITEDLSTWPDEARQLIESVDHIIAQDTFTYTYGDMNLSEALSLLAPNDNFQSIAFETVGHIAHLNLTDDRLPIRHLIGKIIYDTENGIKFKIDYQNVYWNSRLETERFRISQLINPGDFVIDLFAGLGAFAMYTAKKGCLTFANDLNPIASEYIYENAKLNKVEHLIHNYNMDAREFVSFILSGKSILFHEVNSKLTKQQPITLHVLMNLPEMSLDYLDSFVILNELPQMNVQFHTYLFCKNYEDLSQVKEKASHSLGFLPNADFHHVRSVAPNKIMYCMEFPWEYS